MQHRKRNLAKYNLTPEEFDEILDEQEGRCAICGSDDPGRNGAAFAVDHDHDCCPAGRSCGGCVRGLLCSSCNRHLGVVENTEWLALALDYLSLHGKDVSI